MRERKREGKREGEERVIEWEVWGGGPAHTSKRRFSKAKQTGTSTLRQPKREMLKKNLKNVPRG